MIGKAHPETRISQNRVTLFDRAGFLVLLHHESEGAISQQILHQMSLMTYSRNGGGLILRYSVGNCTANLSRGACGGAARAEIGFHGRRDLRRGIRVTGL